MKDVPKKTGGIAMFILIVVSLPLLSITPISTSLFKQGTSVLPKVNALPVEIEDDAIDFPLNTDSILGDMFNKEEIKELYGESPSPSSLPPSDNEKLDTDKPPANFDLNGPSAEILREQGDAIPNQYIVVLKNKFPITSSEVSF